MKPFEHIEPIGPPVCERVIDGIQAGVILLDCHHTIVWANRWMEERYAHKAPLAGQKCYAVLNDLTEPRLDCPYDVCLENGDVYTDTILYLSPEGTTQRLEMTISQLQDDEGKVIGAVGHIEDVTEQRQMEELLREETSRRRLLVEQSSDGIVVLDEEGGVFETNLQFARMLGYPMEEMHELHVWDWECQYPKEAVQAMLEQVDENGAHFESRHLRKDGSTYEVEISTNGAVYGGKKFVFCVCRDITDRKRGEREREALIKSLQEALAEIKALRGILPLCSYCKKIRVEDDHWEQVDVYIQKHSEAAVSHGVCPECMKERYPDLYKGD